MQIDCVHWCQPGALHIVPRLLLHLMLTTRALRAPRGKIFSPTLCAIEAQHRRLLRRQQMGEKFSPTHRPTRHWKANPNQQTN